MGSGTFSAVEHEDLQSLLQIGIKGSVQLDDGHTIFLSAIGQVFHLWMEMQRSFWNGKVKEVVQVEKIAGMSDVQQIEGRGSVIIALSATNMAWMTHLVDGSFSKPVPILEEAGPLMSIHIGDTNLFGATLEEPSTLKFAELDGGKVLPYAEKALTFSKAHDKVQVASGHDFCIALTTDKAGKTQVHAIKGDKDHHPTLGRIHMFQKRRAIDIAANRTHHFVVYDDGNKIAFTDLTTDDNFKTIWIQGDEKIDMIEACDAYALGANHDDKMIVFMQVEKDNGITRKHFRLPDSVVKVDCMRAAGSHAHAFVTVEVDGKIPTATY